MSVNSEMTAIADLIRGLRGVSGKMGLDAMKGHLQDEQDGLDSALAALTEKGVTVPAGTKVDGLAALIEAIEAGGGGSGGGVGDIKITKGTYTPSEDTENLVIEQDFGGTPFALVIWNTSGVLKNHISHAVFILIDSGSYQKVQSLAAVKSPSTNALTSLGPINNTLAEGEWRNGYIRTPTLKLGYTYYMRASVKQSWEVYAI